ncbi:MAG TPA: DUF4175 family protein [Rhodopila sp.]|nr:DUF4175 family protein [Rhodopila sp.]
MTALPPVPPHLARGRLLARAAILFEAIWPALWPSLCVIGLFLIAALLNLLSKLPPAVHLGLLCVGALAVIGLAAYRLRCLRMPDSQMADRRLETDSGLMHRPLSVISDQPAIADELGLALWRAHVTRAVGQIGRLRVALPRPNLARRDPRALRFAVLLGLVAALVIAGPDAPARLSAALSPTLPTAPGVPSAELQAWVTPPGYTRIAPIFLKADGGSVSVPAGSQLTVNVSGIANAPALTLNDRSSHFSALDNHSFQAEMDLTRGGLLRVRHDGADMAAWSLTVIADDAPAAAWGDNPGREPHGQQTRLPWAAADDYGVTSLQAELRLRDRPNAPPLVVNIPLPGGSPRQAHGLNLQDLTAHPWAGLPVIGRLIAHDAAGQSGTSGTKTFELGERPFHNPIARLLIEARKTLSVHPDDRGDALAILDQLLQQPNQFKDDTVAYLMLSSTYYLLVVNHDPGAVDEAQNRLWQLALHMEEGKAERTAQALEQARRNARDAMDKAQQNPSAANRQALEKRLQELRDAIDRHMRALVEQAMRNNNIMPFDPKMAQMTDRDLQRLAENAQKAAREGRMADAQQQMAQLEHMLDQLRNAQPRSAASRQANGKQRQGKSQRSVVQDLIAREGGLMDHAQQRGTPAPDAPSAADPDAQRQADARMQGALRHALGELMQQFTDLTGEASKGLGEADQAMRNALTQLNQGNDPAAGAAQQQAIEALQKGNQEMAQAMAKMGGQPGQGGQGEDGDSQGGMMGMTMMPGDQPGQGRGDGTDPGSPDQAEPGGRDPLGRTAQGSSADSQDVVVPEQRERQRTQAIEEELRRRGADQERPRQELDYINRLLKQF